MGHDHHFLSRLDRVHAEEVDFALTLYRDHAFVKRLLAASSLPAGVERVAVALTDAPEPPHIVLQRDGHFVTCLGEGMTTRDLLVIPRAKLDAVRRQIETQRDREAAMREVDARGGLSGVIERMLCAGPNLTREEMAPVFPLAPILRRLLLDMWGKSTQIIIEAQELFAAQKKLRSRFDAALEMYWQASWAHAHASLVLFHDQPDFLERFTPEGRARSLSIVGMITGFTSVYLRTLAATAKAGKYALPFYRNLLRKPGIGLRVALDCMLALASIGFRHRGLKAEITKLVRSGVDGLALGPEARDDAGRYAKVVLDVLARPETLNESHERALRQIASALSQRFRPGSPLRFERPEDVPAAIIPALGLYIHDHLRLDEASQDRLFMSLQAVVTASPEDLYMPAAYLPLAGPAFDRGQVARSVELLRPKVVAATPSQPRAPGRNEPCSCGSGKKYKRCCAG
jgi:hypothetical protein